MAADDEDLPAAYLFYVSAAMVVITVIAVGVILIFVR
jgi:hypothetical protein